MCSNIVITCFPKHTVGRSLPLWPEIGKRPEWFSFTSRKSEMNAPGGAVRLPFNCSASFWITAADQVLRSGPGEPGNGSLLEGPQAVALAGLRSLCLPDVIQVSRCEAGLPLLELRRPPSRCGIEDLAPRFLASHLVRAHTSRSRSQSTAPRFARRGQWNLWLPSKAKQMPPSKTSTNMPSRDILSRRRRPLTTTGTIV